MNRFEEPDCPACMDGTTKNFTVCQTCGEWAPGWRLGPKGFYVAICPDPSRAIEDLQKAVADRSLPTEDREAAIERLNELLAETDSPIEKAAESVAA